MTNENNFKEPTVYTIYAKSIKEYLLLVIKGKIWTYINDDEIVVRIDSANGVHFQSTITQISNKIVHGVSAQTIAQNTIKQYKKYITNLYFL